VSSASNLQEANFVAYINKLLADAWVKSTDEYKRGYEDGRIDAINAIGTAVHKSADEFFSNMAVPADVFYSMLSEKIPQKDILQYRIGLDYTTKTPTVLTVISHEHEDRLEDIMQMAAEFDLCIFERYKRVCTFWVITDNAIDQNLIDRDFPWYRKKGD